jgi:hypothetical protein
MNGRLAQRSAALRGASCASLATQLSGSKSREPEQFSALFHRHAARLSSDACLMKNPFFSTFFSPLAMGFQRLSRVVSCEMNAFKNCAVRTFGSNLQGK